MAYLATWKTAKTNFENKTKHKKPSVKLLGVFARGTGVEAALKAIDGTKDAGGLNKGLEQFKKVSDDYIKTLDKTIADPSAVPSGDKALYVAEVKVLKAALEKMQTDIQKDVAQSQAAANAELATVKKAISAGLNHFQEVWTPLTNIQNRCAQAHKGATLQYEHVKNDRPDSAYKLLAAELGKLANAVPPSVKSLDKLAQASGKAQTLQELRPAAITALKDLHAVSVIARRFEELKQQVFKEQKGLLTLGPDIALLAVQKTYIPDLLAAFGPFSQDLKNNIVSG
jgi:hypothetical protein